MEKKLLKRASSIECVAPSRPSEGLSSISDHSRASKTLHANPPAIERRVGGRRRRLRKGQRWSITAFDADDADDDDSQHCFDSAAVSFFSSSSRDSASSTIE